MKKLIVLIVIGTLCTFGGVALADDPDGNLQQAIDLIEAEIAKPPVVTTTTVTAPPVTTTVVPPPVTTTVVTTTTVTSTPPPQGSCTGTNVAPGTGSLKTAMDGAPAGTTFCLAAGTYNIPATITFQNGDKVTGASRTTTLVRGTSGVFNIFTGGSGVAWTVEDLDIAGAVGDSTCDPDCGRAFEANGTTLTIDNIRCHDNENQCVGGGGAAVRFLDSECDHNGNLEFVGFTSTRSTSCIKRVREGGDLIVRGSFIHDNIWIGVWCDFCDEGATIIENNTFTGNGKSGVSYEVSGGWGTSDSGRIANNIIQNNGDANNPNRVSNVQPAGITCNSCAELTITGNTFGGNVSAVYFQNAQRGPWGNLRDIFFTNNTLNGDAINCAMTGVTCSGNS